MKFVLEMFPFEIGGDDQRKFIFSAVNGMLLPFQKQINVSSGNGGEEEKIAKIF
jgi:hypothetical protein